MTGDTDDTDGQSGMVNGCQVRRSADHSMPCLARYSMVRQISQKWSSGESGSSEI